MKKEKDVVVERRVGEEWVTMVDIKDLTKGDMIRCRHIGTEDAVYFKAVLEPLPDIGNSDGLCVSQVDDSSVEIKGELPYSVCVIPVDKEGDPVSDRFVVPSYNSLYEAFVDDIEYDSSIGQG